MAALGRRRDRGRVENVLDRLSALLVVRVGLRVPVSVRVGVRLGLGCLGLSLSVGERELLLVHLLLLLLLLMGLLLVGLHLRLLGGHLLLEVCGHRA